MVALNENMMLYARRVIFILGQFSFFRSVIFFALACIHVSRRKHIPSLRNSEHDCSAFAFLCMFVRRYRGGLGSDIWLALPLYLTQIGHSYDPQSRRDIFMAAPLPACWLAFANILKVQGWFADAEALLRSLKLKKTVTPLALLDLGDLILLQACWVNEVVAYGPIINSSVETPAQTCWSKHNYGEAIQLLIQANTLLPMHKDAARLLIWAYVECAEWQKAMEVMEKSLQLTDGGSVYYFLKARIEFSLDTAKGAESYRRTLGTWLGWWQATPVKITGFTELESSLDGMKYKACGAAVTHKVESTSVKQGRVVPYESLLDFEPGYIMRYDEAEILPQYGMILANDTHLIGPSLHHKPCHWRQFTSSLYALEGDRGMIIRKSPVEFSEAGCLFIGGNNNYYHWIIDELSRLALLEDAPEFSDAPILTDHQAGTWQIELLARTGVDRSRIRTVSFADSVKLRDMIAPSHLSTNMVAHPRAVHFMRNKLAPHADTMLPKRGKRLFLTRTSGGARKSQLLNEAEIISLFAKAGFEMVDCATMSIDQQIELFSDAEVIAAPGGAALTNSLFAPKQARIIQISASGMLCETFSSLTSAIGQKHICCIGKSYARPHPTWVWSNFDFVIEEADVKLCLDLAL